MSATVAYIVVLGSLVFMVVATAYARKYPNRSKEYPDRIRMPKVVPILSWAFISFGLVLGVMAWSAPDGPLDARIASVAAVLGGWIFLGMYRNFYLAPGQHEVAFRTTLGRERVLPYSDIADFQLVTRKNNQYLRVKSIHGVRLNVNTSIYDMGPLLRAKQYHESTGRWPGRGEPSPKSSVGGTLNNGGGRADDDGVGQVLLEQGDGAATRSDRAEAGEARAGAVRVAGSQYP